MSIPVAKDQLIFNGELLVNQSSEELPTYEGRVNKSLSPLFVKSQQEKPSFIHIPFVIIEGLPPGTYSVTAVSKIATSNVSVDLFTPKTLLFGISNTSTAFPFLTVYNPVSYPFIISSPQQDFSLEVKLKTLRASKKFLTKISFTTSVVFLRTL